MEDHPIMKAYYATEYHRRNMQVARVTGAEASVNLALNRSRSVKSIPLWLISYLESAAERLPGISADLAAWRDISPDADIAKNPKLLIASIIPPSSTEQ
jgi:hypothetical protein